MTNPSASALEIARAIQLPEKIVHIMGHDPLVVCLPGEELFTVIARAIDEARLGEREAIAQFVEPSWEPLCDGCSYEGDGCDCPHGGAVAAHRQAMRMAEAIRNRT